MIDDNRFEPVLFSYVTFLGDHTTECVLAKAGLWDDGDLEICLHLGAESGHSYVLSELCGKGSMSTHADVRLKLERIKQAVDGLLGVVRDFEAKLSGPESV